MRDKLTNLIIKNTMKRKWFFIVSSILLTVFFMWTSSFLKFDMRWTALLPEDLAVVKEFKKIDDNFYQPGNMIIALKGDDSETLEKLADETGQILKNKLLMSAELSFEENIKNENYAAYIYSSFPSEWLYENSLSLLKPKDAKRIYKLFKEPNLYEYLVALNNDFEAEYTDSENIKNQENDVVRALNVVEELLNAINNASEGRRIENINRLIRDITIGNPYFISLDKKMILIMVASAVPSDDFQTTPLIDKRIEKLLEALKAKYPGYSIERTGLTAVGRDELDSMGPSTAIITFLAFVMIFILLMWNYRSSLTPVISLVPIVLGIIWATGFIALTLGVMNMITSMIMVVLLGLGIDFTIHLTTRFYEEFTSGVSCEDSLKAAFIQTGSGVITGALTTSVAFLSLTIAKTRAIKEFGYCAGVGIIITLIASFWILPALLSLKYSDEKRHKIKKISNLNNLNLLGIYAEKMISNKKKVLIIFALLCVLGFIAGKNLDWEWNFMNLEPKGLKSVELQDEIVERFKMSSTPGMLVADSIEESRKFKKALKTRAFVSDVDDLSSWLSRPDFNESLIHLKKLKTSLLVYKQKNIDVNIIEKTVMELDRLWANIVEMQALSFTGGQDKIYKKTLSIVSRRENREIGPLKILYNKFEKADVNEKAFRIFLKDFNKTLFEKTKMMTANLHEVDINMVPEEIKARYIARKGSGYLINIMPTKNLYDREAMELFQNSVSKVSDKVTGIPELMLTMSLETIKEGKMTLLIALGIIFLILLVDFYKHPILAFMSLIPLVSGLALTLGTMYLIGEKLNYMNIIALPVIIGIGVDDGVHFFHRYLKDGPGKLKESISGVGRAILMTSLTTMIGFGSLMLYLMRGMASMGRVLFIGVGMAFLVSMTILPVLAQILNKYIFKGDVK